MDPAPTRNTVWMHRRILGIPASMLTLIGLAMPLAGQEASHYLELGAGSRQGDFGTATTSTLRMTYATYGASGSRWDASLTVPYLKVSRSGGGISSSDQVLGDVVVRGAYRFLPETEDGWSLDGLGAIKLPTASDTKGLGTGRSDAGVFLALNQRMGLFQWTVLGGRIQGASGDPGVTTEPLTPGSSVFAVRGSWTFEGTRWGLSLEARGPAYQGLPGAREITLEVFHPVSYRWALKATATAGLSDGGPRQGVTLGVVRFFL